MEGRLAQAEEVRRAWCATLREPVVLAKHQQYCRIQRRPAGWQFDRHVPTDTSIGLPARRSRLGCAKSVHAEM
jgi:hypothetical protein